MSEENVEIVRRSLEALDRRDLTTWLAVVDGDYEVVPTSDWPEPGVRGAEAAFIWYVQAFDTVEQAPVVETEFVDAGADKVLLHYRVDLRGAESGAEVKFNRWCVITTRKGRLLRTEWFSDCAEALEAAGLSE